MTIKALEFLTSEEGRKILEEYKNVGIKDLPSLAFKLSKKKVPFFSEIVTLLKLRSQAQGKFVKSQEMFFTDDGLEQASGERISSYVARRIKELIKDGTVTDLTCGVGGSAIFLAKYLKVRAVDIDEVHLSCARHNAERYGVSASIEFIHGLAEDNLNNTEAFIIDPQRIRDGQTKTRSIYNSQPNIVELLPQMLKVTENICLKISPAFDYEEILKLPGNPEIEIISEDNVNKGAFLWFGQFRGVARRATIIDGDTEVTYTGDRGKNRAETAAALNKYIYIPNKAIIKAELSDEVASRFKLHRISHQNELMTAHELINYPPKVFRTFEVLEYSAFSMSKTKELIKRKALDRAHIVARHFGINPEDLRKTLKLKEGGQHTLIFTEWAGEKYVILGRNI
ncbi:MAG: class I SAM-dependent methyltransferase [bacterium]|nr:class I SAM-dependent methyltransferase [bacterium]